MGSGRLENCERRPMPLPGMLGEPANARTRRGQNARPMNAHDICVRGQGPAGRALALALSAQGWRVALTGDAARTARPGDLRTYALNARAVKLLSRIKVWDALLHAGDAATRVLDMQVCGDDGGHIAFSAWEQCETELAWIVDAQALDEALAQALRYAAHVAVVPEDDPAAAAAPLVAICEGARSATRAAMDAGVRRQEYGHTAVAARLVADRPHAGVARQWFRSPDILALLPFDRPEPGRSYGLVWSQPHAQAQRLLALDDAAFEAELNAATGGAAGALRLGSARAGWPLSLVKVERWCGPGWVVVGDAAHQVHPLAGQGLNLGLADVDTLARVLGEARRHEPWRSPGDERLLRRYVRERAAPTAAMAGLTDGLLHLFANPAAPLRELRNRGMSALGALPPVKRWLVGRALD